MILVHGKLDFAKPLYDFVYFDYATKLLASP